MATAGDHYCSCFSSMRPTCFCPSATRIIPTTHSSQYSYASWNIIKESCSLPPTESGILMMRSRAGSTLRFGMVLWVLIRERGSGIPFFKMQSRPAGKQTTVTRTLTNLAKHDLNGRQSRNVVRAAHGLASQERAMTSYSHLEVRAGVGDKNTHIIN
ncbi:hypothetical protein DL95DRAFT_141114 [Leptodontidium sp. 2 PMI_412]|nr:hypothetical protein DL95DRAFT_141114 [Leptodontidium sp. 2 PMI_412]